VINAQLHKEYSANYKADIIITALGVPNYLKAEMVKDGAVVLT
jgi:5,10-methylene-tetrahydrofolate dehydrogenase/methenyl tetrahydrofolate cyclohydrolase